MMTTDNKKAALYKQLAQHACSMQSLHMRDLFMHDSERGHQYAYELPGIYIDCSRNITTPETLALLHDYAAACGIKDSISAMFNGEKINHTEDRAVLHCALRSDATQSLIVDDVDVIGEIHAELKRMQTLVDEVHGGERLSASGKPFDTFVNIGIGGSDLGAKMVVDALTPYRRGHTRSCFISNIDYEQIEDLKRTVNPETTLFIISSKSFSTTETLVNADSIRQWLKASGCKQLDKQLLAVTAKPDVAIKYGIVADNIFKTWDWVGGRFSLWSATGLPIALALGFENFKQLLAGAHAIDEHLRHASLKENVPLILALHDFWYNNFMGAETHAIIPYDESLRLFPDYLSQLFMESNGKSTSVGGHRLDYQTMPIIWGSVGTNSQHAFFQLLHQGSHIVPIDFLAALKKGGDEKHHRLLLANCFAQSQALMQGEESLDAHRLFPGNNPSITILYDELSPYTVGALLAIYEHRTFMQGLLWDINSFDQWGVELGKKLATQIMHKLDNNDSDSGVDSSTQNLINRYKKIAD